MKIKKIFLLFVLLFLATPLCFAEAATSGDIKNLPHLSRYQVSQLGDSEIFLIFYGKGLPTPEVLQNEGDDDLRIVFRNSYSTVKAGVANVPELPLLTELSFSQEGRDAVIHLQAEGPLVLKELKGVGPANRYSVILSSEKKITRLEAERKLLERQLPPVPPIAEFNLNTPVTFELREVALPDVIRMLGGIVKKGVVIDKSMPNNLVTMSLNGVPFNEVMNYLKRMYDIDFATMGQNTIIAGARDSLSRLSGREATRSFNVAYADVAKIPDLLAGVMSLTDEEKKKIIPDDRLRTIYVTASHERLEEIAVALQRIDAPGRQVMLHARILEFGDDQTSQVETMINAIYDNWWFSFAEGAGIIGVIDRNKTGDMIIDPIIAPTEDLIKRTTRMIDGAMMAYKENLKGKILANPSVITVDGKPATVNLRTEYPYRVAQQTTGGSSQLYTTETKEAGPQLVMTPKIGRDGVITIELDLETSELISFSTDGPTIARRSVKTNVRVRNGEPFVVGGLHRESDTKTVTKFPILGDIPLIGFLFRKTSSNTYNTQVVMLVVPYILDVTDAAVESYSVPFRR